jgi:hypothetical protein
MSGCAVALVVAVLANGSPARAQKMLPQGDAPVAKPTRDDPLKAGAAIWDTNHDGTYTCDEWKAYLDRLFTSADRNRDGNLNAAEFAIVRQASPMLADADFGYFDENQDGKLTRQEFISKPSEFILKYDKNGDCRATADEINATPDAAAPPSRGGGRKR